MPPDIQTYASLFPTPQHVGLTDGMVDRGRGVAHRTSRQHHGIRHSSFKITSVFGVQCSIFGVHFSSAYKYDFNGNITELERYAGVDKIDDLEYYYDHSDHTAKLDLVSNRLYLVDEQSTHPGGNDLKSGTKTAAGFDRNDPTSWNYQYDPTGNLIKDVNDSIDLITWTVTGKGREGSFEYRTRINERRIVKYLRIKELQQASIGFHFGIRHSTFFLTSKIVNRCSLFGVQKAWYARDAQGNVLAVYNKAQDSLNFRATEFNIYGSSRIGMVTQPEQLTQPNNDTLRHNMVLGLKVYEFSNHLGNVLTTLSDRKIAVEGTPGYVAHYTAEILSSTDYYPFGFQMPGRVYEAEGYRYGFNSMEKDDEVKGSGNSYTTEFRLLDVRIGRWWSIDPVVHHFQSPYCTFDNNPILITDPSGADGGGDSTGAINATVFFFFDQDAGLDAQQQLQYIQTYQNNVQNTWNNFSLPDGTPVNVNNVQFLPAPAGMTPANAQGLLQQNQNLITVGNGAGDPLARQDIQLDYINGNARRNTGYAYVGNNAADAAHEFGHMLGLSDRYVDGVIHRPTDYNPPSSFVDRYTLPLVFPEAGYLYQNNLMSLGGATLSPTQIAIAFDRNQLERQHVNFAAIHRQAAQGLYDGIDTRGIYWNQGNATNQPVPFQYTQRTNLNNSDITPTWHRQNVNVYIINNRIY